MRAMLTLCLLAAAVPAFALAPYESDQTVRPPLRDPPKSNVVACKTLAGIQFVRARTALWMVTPRKSVVYANKAVPGAGCRYFDEVEYVEAEDEIEYERVGGKMVREVRYTRVLIVDLGGASYYTIAGIQSFRLFVREGTLDESE